MHIIDTYIGRSTKSDPLVDLMVYREEHLQPRKVSTIDLVILRWHIQVSVER